MSNCRVPDSERTRARRRITASRALATPATLLLVSLVLSACSLSDNPLATQPLESDSLQPLAGLEPRSFFGDAVAIESGVVAVGAWGAQSERGSVRLYGQAGDEWQVTSLLQPVELEDGDRFGHALSLSGDELVVGAPRSRGEDGSESAGAVYYFRRTAGEWELAQRLTPPANAGGAHFGSAIAVEGGDLAVVAAEAGEQTLHLYALRNGVWNREQSFALDTLGVGHRLAMGEGLVAVGARLAGGSSAVGNQGLLRLFALVDGSWTEVPAPVVDEPGECFGCAVGISGDLLAVGSPSPSSGVAFVFRRTVGAWKLLGRVNDGSGSAHFGHSVAVGDDVALVGAPGDDTSAENVGRLFAYSIHPDDSIEFAAGFSPPGLLAGSGFGSTIDIDSGTALVGAPGLNMASGAAYLSGWESIGIQKR